MDRTKLLDELYAALDKTVGKGAGRPLGATATQALLRIPSSMLGFNYVLGGGLPRGRITELLGTESGGKTSLAIDCMAQCQRAGGTVAFIDAEHSFDPTWAAKLGLDVDTTLYHAPDSGEEALTAVELMVKSGAMDLVVVDSVSALVPKAELEGSMGEAHMGLQARLMSQALRKLAGHVDTNNCSLVFINQVREKIGVMFGSNETTSGGRALRYWSSVRVDVRRGETIRVQQQPVGVYVKLNAIKNKTATPFKKAMIPLSFEHGFDAAGEAMDIAVDLGLITKAGSWYSMDTEQIGQGRDAAVAWLRQRPDVLQALQPKLVIGT